MQHFFTCAVHLNLYYMRIKFDLMCLILVNQKRVTCVHVSVHAKRMSVDSLLFSVCVYRCSCHKLVSIPHLGHFGMTHDNLEKNIDLWKMHLCK